MDREGSKRAKQKSRFWRSWYAKNKRKALQDAKDRRQKLREMIIKCLGGKCARCPISDHRLLQIDHVKGGGTAEVRRANWNVYKVHRRVLKDTKGRFQLLCANCNWLKRLEKRSNRG